MLEAMAHHTRVFDITSNTDRQALSDIRDAGHVILNEKEYFGTIPGFDGEPGEVVLQRVVDYRDREADAVEEDGYILPMI